MSQQQIQEWLIMLNRSRSIISSGLGAVLLVCLAIAAPAVLGQKLTLKEIARVNGGKASTRISANVPFGSWERVADTAELIIRGQITSVQPRLTRDDDNILTYVSLAPLEFLKGIHKQALPKPGFASGIIFVHGGGKVVVDGLELTVHHEMAPEPALQVGEQVIAFLTPMTSEPGVFNLAYGTYGLVRVQGGKIANSNPRTAKTRPIDSRDVSEFQKKIRCVIERTAK
jgi:hypothetical protein